MHVDKDACPDVLQRKISSGVRELASISVHPALSDPMYCVVLVLLSIQNNAS